MRASLVNANPRRTRLGKHALGAVAGLLLPFTVSAGGLVTAPTEANLRAAIALGAPVRFACDGTITLSSPLAITADTVLDASGHQVSISGGDLVRVFYVGTNTSLTLVGLTVANGLGNQGAGIFNAGGQLILQNCLLANNLAIGAAGSVPSGSPGTNADGGAVYNVGTVNAINCRFISNSVAGGNGAVISGVGTGGRGGSGNGGAIGNIGTLFATGSTFAWNQATGGTGGVGAPESQGGAGGDGNGGAIANYGALNLNGCLMISNSCAGGTGGAGGSGPYAMYATPGGPGGAGGSGSGGALFNNDYAALVNDTLVSNSATGANGGGGGPGSPPWNQSSWSGNGGAGGGGGGAYGAVQDISGGCYLTNCTLALNQATPGAGGAGGPAGPWIYPYPPHLGTPGPDGGGGPAGGALNSINARLVNTLFASNSPLNGTATVTDAGHNLSSDRSLGFAGPGSLNNTDPQLAAPANNGGPTLTMALLAGSPAIDAGDPAAAPPTDQRGFPRPAGSAADIGAYEFNSMPPVLAIAQTGPDGFDLLVHGNTNQWCRLFTTTNFIDWTAIATNQISGDGTFRVPGNHAPSNSPGRFYRVVMP